MFGNAGAGAATAAAFLFLVRQTQAIPTVPNSDSCDGLETCSPAGCVTDNSLPTCFFGKSGYTNWASKVAEMTCTQCTQSTASFCSELQSVFKQDAGVKATYCNDEFLVVWATGLPRYDVDGNGDYLDLIPRPPGGSARRRRDRRLVANETDAEFEGRVRRQNADTCRVKTGISSLNVYKIPLTTSVQSGTNSVSNPLPGVSGIPAAGAIGVAIDGTPIFPNYNNRGQFAWESCEVCSYVLLPLGVSKCVSVWGSVFFHNH